MHAFGRWEEVAVIHVQRTWLRSCDCSFIRALGDPRITASSLCTHSLRFSFHLPFVCLRVFKNSHQAFLNFHYKNNIQYGRIMPLRSDSRILWVVHRVWRIVLKYNVEVKWLVVKVSHIQICPGQTLDLVCWFGCSRKESARVPRNCDPSQRTRILFLTQDFTYNEQFMVTTTTTTTMIVYVRLISYPPLYICTMYGATHASAVPRRLKPDLKHCSKLSFTRTSIFFLSKRT